jgi:hypothetical protein
VPVEGTHRITSTKGGEQKSQETEVHQQKEGPILFSGGNWGREFLRGAPTSEES